MKQNVKPIPEGYHALTPMLMVKDGAKYIEFLKKAFGAIERFRMDGPNGALMHAEMMIGDSIMMIGQAGGEIKAMPTALYFYVNDADATYKRALSAGGRSKMEPTDQFWGDRNGEVIDPEGNFWWIATHVEDVAVDEMRKRGAQRMKEHCKEQKIA